MEEEGCKGINDRSKSKPWAPNPIHREFGYASLYLEVGLFLENRLAQLVFKHGMTGLGVYSYGDTLIQCMPAHHLRSTTLGMLEEGERGV